MGERAGRREAVDRMVKRLVNSGFDPRVAKQKAVAAATRKDRKER